METLRQEHNTLTESVRALIHQTANNKTPHSTTLRINITNTLQLLQDHIDQCLKHQTLYYAVHDATILVFQLATRLMRAEHARLAVRPLAHALLALGASVPLQQLRFWPWRLRLATALCHCYEASDDAAGALRAASHALDALDEQQALDALGGGDVDERPYASARRRLASLRLKYELLSEAPAAAGASGAAGGGDKDKGSKKGKGAAAPPTSAGDARLRGRSLAALFGDRPADQLQALLEVLADYTARGASSATRDALRRDGLAAALAVASPLLDALDAGAAAAERRAAASTAEEEGTASRVRAEEDSAAAAAEDAPPDEVAAEAAMAEAEAALKAAADADIALPLSLHADLARAASGASDWVAFERLSRTALTRALAASAEARAAAAGAEAAAHPALDGTRRLDDASSELWVWAELRMLELRRRVNSAPEGATDESVASSQLELAKHLELCCGARLAGLPAAHPDEFGDAALLLWRKVCVARLAALEKRLDAQARGGSPAAAAVAATAASSGKFHLRIAPVAKRWDASADGARLASALAELAEREPDVSYKLEGQGGASLRCDGELKLRIAADGIVDRLDGRCSAGSILTPKLLNKDADNGNGAIVADELGLPTDALSELRLLVSAGWSTMRCVALDDAQLLATVATALVRLDLMLGRADRAVTLGRAALTDVVDARSSIILSLARAGAPTAPGVTAEAPTADGPGARSAQDGLGRALASLHADLLVLTFRAELAKGLDEARTSAEAAHARKVAARMHRRSQRYGAPSTQDAKREAREDDEPVPVPTRAPAAERKLLNEFAADPYAHALLLLEVAAYRTEVADRAKVLSKALAEVERATSLEGVLLEAAATGGTAADAVASVGGGSTTARQPPPPQLVYRTARALCVRPCAWEAAPKGLPRPAKAAVFAKLAGSVGVSTNNSDFEGSSVHVALGVATADEPLRGGVVLTNLPPNAVIVFAAAYYTESGEQVGGIGASSVEVPTSLPLPLSLLKSYAARAPAALGVRPAARAASALLLRSLAIRAPPAPLWARSLESEWTLRRGVLDSSAAELRGASIGLLIQARAAASASDVDVLRTAQLRVLALQLAFSADDGALACAVVGAIANGLVPLLRRRQKSGLTLAPLASALAALKLEPATAAANGDGALKCVKMLTASLAYELVNVADASNLRGLVAWARDLGSRHLEGDTISAATGDAAVATAEARARALFREWAASADTDAKVVKAAASDALAGSVHASLASGSLVDARSALGELSEEMQLSQQHLVRLQVSVAEHGLNAASSDDTTALEGVRAELRAAIAVACRRSATRPLHEAMDEATASAATAAGAAGDKATSAGAGGKGSKKSGAAVAAAPPPPVNAEEAAVRAREAARLAASHKIGAMLAALRTWCLERDAARQRREEDMAWLAKARLLLARCAAVMGPSPPPPAAEASAAKDDAVAAGTEKGSTQAMGDASANAGAPEAERPPTGLEEVLCECSRALVLSVRAGCRVLALQVAAALYEHATRSGIAPKGFDALARPHGKTNPPDPMPEVSARQWKAAARGAEALVEVMRHLRSGAPLYSADAVSRELSGCLLAPPLSSDNSDAISEGHDTASLESLSRGPHGWLELRDSSADVTPLEVGAAFGLFATALRLLQRGRVWRRQEELAVTLNDLGDGMWSHLALPYLEQAQRKIRGGEFADGQPLPAVAHAVRELDARTSVCTKALKRARLAVATAYAAAAEEPDEAHLLAVQEYKACVDLCRSRRESVLLVTALSELAGLQLRMGANKAAASSLRNALDSTLGAHNALHGWRELLLAASDGAGAATTEEASSLPLHRWGPRGCALALALCGALVLHVSHRQSSARLEAAALAGVLARSLFCASATHPARLADFGGYRLHELISDRPSPFAQVGLGAVGDELDLFGELRLLDGLQAAGSLLVDHGEPLGALPILCLYRHLASHSCRDAAHTLLAEALVARAESAAGQPQHAIATMHDAYSAAHLPVEAAIDPIDAPRARRDGLSRAPPRFNAHAPPADEANVRATAALAALVADAALQSRAGWMAVSQLELARVETLVSLARAADPISLHDGGDSETDADAKPPEPAPGGAAKRNKGVAAAAVSKDLAVDGSEASTLALAETLLTKLQDSVSSRLPPAAEVASAAAPSGDGAEAAISISCRCLALRARIHSARGYFSAAQSALHDAMGMLGQVQEGQATVLGAVATPPCLQLAPGSWARLRVRLAELALTQGLWSAAFEQLDIGASEANVADDVAARRHIERMRILLHFESGEVGAGLRASDEWLAGAKPAEELPSCAVSRAAVATDAAEQRLALVPLEGSGASEDAVSLARGAVSELRAEAVRCGMRSIEEWPCLESGHGAAAELLVNRYLPPLRLLARAQLLLAEALASAANVTRTDAAEAESLATSTISLLGQTASPPPTLAVRARYLSGRLAANRLAASAGSGWGGVAAEGGALDPTAQQLHGAAGEVVTATLQEALEINREAGPLDLALQAQIHVELALLRGAAVNGTPSPSAANVAAAASHLAAAAAAARSHHTILRELPALAGAPLSAPLPKSLELALQEMAAAAAVLPGATVAPDEAAVASRRLLSLHASLMLARAMPRLDGGLAEERHLVKLQAYLLAHSAPFKAALPDAAAGAELVAPFACVQWRAPSSASPELTMLYAIKSKEAAASGVVVGRIEMQRATVLGLYDALSRLSFEQSQPHVLAAAAGPEGARDACERALEAVFGPPRLATPVAAESDEGAAAKEEEAAEEAGSAPHAPRLADELVAPLRALFDTTRGGGVESEPLCAWLLCQLRHT